MIKIQHFPTLAMLLFSAFVLVACNNDDEAIPNLEVPSTYTSANFDANVTAERAVRTEIGNLTADLNSAESNAPNAGLTAITYPSNLKAVTLPSYASKIEAWLPELVKAANSSTAFVNPGLGGSPSGEGGLLGTRLLDENGLELEQMVEKGSFGAALYNHALTVINGDLNSATTDKLIEIFGTDMSFNVSAVTNAATYARRRSNLSEQTGFFFDIRDNLLVAKAAIEAGANYNAIRDQALADFKLNWEKSNFATVIFYCNATKELITNASNDTDRGNAMHAYAEGVAFTAGWKGISDKQITDAQIDEILEKLLAKDGETPESHKFLNDAQLLSNLDEIITLIKGIYGFTDAEVASFYVNNNP